MKNPERKLPSDGNISGRTFDDKEAENLQAVLSSGKLNCTNGTWVNTFQQKFSEYYKTPFARCVTSGTAAIHTAIAAINPEPGDEIITTPITDMGALTPIIYQTAIPIFADIDPRTYNITAETIAPHINNRTRAIIVTHLFGNPCDMQPILELAQKHQIPVIEDAAQSFLAEYKGQLAGTFGAIGCFSLQQGKHMTTGEGGIVISSQADYAKRASLFIDKAWGYGDPCPDHYFLALNYRMTELQGAVALGQFEKLHSTVNMRIEKAELLTKMISHLEGVLPPISLPQSKHVYWKYCLDIDPQIIRGGVEAFSAALKSDYNIFSNPRYIQKPAFKCRIFQDFETFGKSGFPFKGAHRNGLPAIEYKTENYPGAMLALKRICVLPWNEKYTADDVEFIGNALIETALKLRE